MAVAKKDIRKLVECMAARELAGDEAEEFLDRGYYSVVFKTRDARGHTDAVLLVDNIYEHQLFAIFGNGILQKLRP